MKTQEETLRIIERGEEHYETKEVPFGRIYEWHPAYVVLECDCGEKALLTAAASPTTTTSSSSSSCRCAADRSAFIRDIREREGRLAEEGTHPWRYDTEAQAGQRLRNEAAYPEGSPWRYDDVTSRGTDDGRDVQ